MVCVFLRGGPDRGREGIATAQQQVERRNERHHTRNAVDDDKQYRWYRYLPEYLHFGCKGTNFLPNSVRFFR